MFSIENYTTYSILSGVLNPDKWVARAKELGYQALGICDKGALYGHIDFQNQCKAADIKPIFGASYVITPTYDKGDTDNYGTILLFAKTYEGYKSLITCNNIANDVDQGFHYYPRLTIEDVVKHGEDLIVIVPDDYGILDGDPEWALDATRALLSRFNEDLYLGSNLANRTPQEAAEWLSDASELFGAKVVPTFHCHYPREQDAHLYPVVRRMDMTRRSPHNADRKVTNGHLPDFELMDLDTVYSEHLQEIYDKCNCEIPTGVYYVPETNTDGKSTEHILSESLITNWVNKLDPEAADAAAFLMDQPELTIESVLDTLKEYYQDYYPQPYLRSVKYPNEDHGTLKQYLDRLTFEVDIITSKGFLDYFNIVRDLVEQVDRAGEDRGPGRGSAAGSLFSYLLNITQVDPLEHQLLFERFLNPDRNDYPDIDMDFSGDSRDKLKAYLAEQYGEDRVVSIGTFERFKVAGLMQSVLAAYDWHAPDESGEDVFYDRTFLTDVTGSHVAATLRGQAELDAYLEDERFAQFYMRHQTWFETIIVPLFESVNNIGIHPAGVIVTDLPVDQCMPVRRRRDVTVAQWRDKDVEKRGYVKLDILGVDAINIVSYTKQLIRRRHNVEIPSVEDLPLDDSKVYSLFCEARTDGIHQFKSYSQHLMLPKFQPSAFSDLVIATSIERPGPKSAGADKEIIDIRKGLKPTPTDTPAVEEITKETYGFVVYQEQLMQICQAVAGFSGSEADYVRKACGKKDLVEMAKWSDRFISGGKANGYEEEYLYALWHKLAAFAEYGFNKSHSVSYCLTSYYQAYMKAYFPAEFWCSALKHANTDAKKYESVFALKGRAGAEGFNFVFPTLHGFSESFYPLDDHTIVWPVSGIKGIGDKAAQGLTQDGKVTSYESLEDMIEQLGTKLNLRTFKILIAAGFYDSLADTPWEAAEIAFATRNRMLKKKDEIPYDLMHQDRALWQKTRNEIYGFTVSSWKDAAPFHENVQVIDEKSLKAIEDGTMVFIGGLVTDIRIRPVNTNRDRFFARITITDDGEKFTAYIWPSRWMTEELDEADSRPLKGDLVEMIGVKQSFNERPQVNATEDSYFRIVRRA